MLKAIVQYLEEVFCDHEWKVEESIVYGSHQEYRNISGHTQLIKVVNDIPDGKKWTYCCKKCGAIKVKKNY